MNCQFWARYSKPLGISSPFRFCLALYNRFPDSCSPPHQAKHYDKALPSPVVRDFIGALSLEQHGSGDATPVLGILVSASRFSPAALQAVHSYAHPLICLHTAFHPAPESLYLAGISWNTAAQRQLPRVAFARSRGHPPLAPQDEWEVLEQVGTHFVRVTPQH